ncbi:MAG: hypothetical protein Q8R82_06800 [Hyphomonadaceae bacterium]|nr:hypothetical protein [Hyphomonadaceae bacterium]
MLHPSTQQLIRKLCELTHSGAIEWKEGADQRSIFETEGYVVEIQAEPPAVRLLRADGQELESADAEDLAAPWDDGDGTYGTHVADMARRASRIARGAETAIAKILSSLSAPPKKQPEPEPEPAALAFAAAAQKPAQSVRASESAAAIAAVTADLESQRRKAAEDPPISHAPPEAPVMIVAPETETAIDRVLAIQPMARPEQANEEPASPEPVATLIAPVTQEPAIPAPIADIKPHAPVLTPPRAIDLPPPFADSTMQPQLPPLTVPQIVAAPAAPPEPKPQAAPAPTAKSGFGSIAGFSRSQQEPAPQPKPEPKAPPAKITSGGLLISGISARSFQTVEPANSRDFYRPLAPQSAPASTAQAPPAAPEKKPPLPVASGADLYKPWA